MRQTRFAWIGAGILSFFAQGASAEAPTEIKGRDPQGLPCSLTVESWGYSNGAINQWYALQMDVRTSWQLPSNAKLRIERSPTPFALYGRNDESRDQIAVYLDPVDPSPSGIRSFIFQTYDDQRGLFQSRCLIR